MARNSTWGSPIWGFTRPYPGTNTYGPGGPAPGQSPPPSYSTARRLPPSFPPVNLNDQDDELTDEDRELLELLNGGTGAGTAAPPARTPTPPPGGGNFPDASSGIPGSPGIWEPGMAVPEDAEVTWRQIPQKDRRGNIIGYLSAQVLVKKKAQEKEKSSPTGPGTFPGPGGRTYTSWVDAAGNPIGAPFDKQDPLADANKAIEANLNKPPGTYSTWGYDAQGRLREEYRTNNTNQVVGYGSYAPPKATTAPKLEFKPVTFGDKTFIGKYENGQLVGFEQNITPKPTTWQPSGQTENVTMRPGGPMPFGLAGQWTGAASVVPFEQLRDEQGNVRWQQQQTSAPPRELVNLQRQTATEQELIDLQRKIAAGQIPGTLTDILRTSSDIEGQQLAAKEDAEKKDQKDIQKQVGAYKAAEMANPRSWINNALQAGQTPSVPPRLAGIIGQAPGTPLQKRPPVMPTADMWRTLTDADKDALFGYLSWVGIDPQEWMMQLSRQWAPWGAGAPDMGARFGVVRQR